MERHNVKNVVYRDMKYLEHCAVIRVQGSLLMEMEVVMDAQQAA